MTLQEKIQKKEKKKRDKYMTREKEIRNAVRRESNRKNKLYSKIC